MTRLPFLLLALLASACALPPAAAPGAVTVSGPFVVRPAAAYRLAGAPEALRAWTDADVAYVAVFVQRDGEPEAALGRYDDLDQPLVLGNLRKDAVYALRLEAYTADRERIDANADDGDGPDGDVEDCVTTFDTFDGELARTLPGGFTVRLVDRTYRGAAGGTLGVTPGGVGAPDGPEAFVTPSTGGPD